MRLPHGGLGTCSPELARKAGYQVLPEEDEKPKPKRAPRRKAAPKTEE